MFNGIYLIYRVPKRTTRITPEGVENLYEYLKSPRSDWDITSYKKPRLNWFDNITGLSMFRGKHENILLWTDKLSMSTK